MVRTPPKFIIFISRVVALVLFGVMQNDPDGSKLAQHSSSEWIFGLKVMFLVLSFVGFAFIGLYPWPWEKMP